MSVGIGNTVEAFSLFYDSLWRPEFRKSLQLNAWSERQLLPLVRTFLLGYFGESLMPEARSVLPGSLSGRGRIDFLVGDVAVEFVVRRPMTSKAVLSPAANSTEVKKLLKHDGHSLLVLYDLSRDWLTGAGLEGFRVLPSLGRGFHKKSAFNLAYYHLTTVRPLKTDVIRKTIHAY
jgi:hypothetical protein